MTILNMLEAFPHHDFLSFLLQLLTLAIIIFLGVGGQRKNMVPTRRAVQLSS